MSPETGLSETGQAILGGALSIPVLGWLAVRLLRVLTSDKRSIAEDQKLIVKESAETFVIDTMRKELSQAKEELREEKRLTDQEVSVIREKVVTLEYRVRDSQIIALEAYGEICVLKSKYNDPLLDSVASKLKVITEIR